MVRRRDVIKCLGMSGAAELILSGAGRAAERTGRMRATARPAGGPWQHSALTSVPFTHFGRPGTLAIRYGVTVDPATVGFDVVPGLGLDTQQCRGYPIIRATIERYGGAGYRTICGWIQVVTAQHYRSGDEETTPAETSTSVDQFPSMIGVDLPFAIVGFLPELFDAPCGNLNGFARLRWTADSFLATVPLKSRTEPIRRLAGMRWGYINESARTGLSVQPLPLSITNAHAWNAQLSLLRERFPDWRFAES